MKPSPITPESDEVSERNIGRDEPAVYRMYALIHCTYPPRISGVGGTVRGMVKRALQKSGEQTLHIGTEGPSRLGQIVLKFSLTDR